MMGEWAWLQAVNWTVVVLLMASLGPACLSESGDAVPLDVGLYVFLIWRVKSCGTWRLSTYESESPKSSAPGQDLARYRET